MNIVSTGQLRAQSISIQASTRTRCNGGCKYCISRLTPNVEKADERVQICDFHDVKKGLNYAKRLGATHAVITGKAEPTQEDVGYICDLIGVCSSKEFLVDMHTNGFLLQEGKSEHSLEDLVDSGLTMITFSIAHHDPDINAVLMGVRVDYPSLIKKAVGLGLLVRCSLVLCESSIKNEREALSYIRCMGSLGVHMVVIRRLWTPSTYTEKNKEVYEWNRKNEIPLHAVSYGFSTRSKAGSRDSDWIHYPLYELAPLPWGAPVYAMEGCFDDSEHGVNITFAECDANDAGPVLKSIVHKPNGHGYRNWDFNGNILY